MTSESPGALRETLLNAVSQAADGQALEAARLQALGRKGLLTAAMKDVSALPAAERRARGEELNLLKGEIAAAVAARKQALDAAELQTRLQRERLDVTLPPRPEGRPGALHPLSQTWDEVVAIFGEMGFAVAEGPDIEDDFHNFTALNIPAEHPARQEHDTFYLCGADGKPDYNRVLRTHTSPVQIRSMQAAPPPIRVIAPGRTYRADSDMTHTPMFSQVEGLVIDRTTHFGHLKGCLQEFCRAYFEVDEAPLRFRASYFPFTEPSAEVDIRCDRSGGELKIGVGADWLEILGCGMVHPNVLRACGLDPEVWQGFAFGMGMERIAMLKYGIPDLRTFFDADLRWLRHYGFPPLEAPSLLRGLRP